MIVVHNRDRHMFILFILFILLLLLLLQACGLHNQVANELGTLTERQI